MQNVAHATLGPNFYRVTLGTVSLWFSYDTIIAFAAPGHVVISTNAWGKTTGKHLNQIDDDKSKRVDRETFLAMLDKVHLAE